VVPTASAARWLHVKCQDVTPISFSDFTKDRIPWKKIRGLICRTDGECAQVIASSPRFENEFIAATGTLDEDDIYSVVADPILRKALKPEDK
jgi:hypothetical protein